MFMKWQKKKKLGPFYFSMNKKNVNGQISGSLFSSKNELELYILMSINLKSMLSEEQDSE